MPSSCKRSPTHFQAGCATRWPSLALLLYVYFHYFGCAHIFGYIVLCCISLSLWVGTTMLNDRLGRMSLINALLSGVAHGTLTLPRSINQITADISVSLTLNLIVAISVFNWSNIARFFLPFIFYSTMQYMLYCHNVLMHKKNFQVYEEESS